MAWLMLLWGACTPQEAPVEPLVLPDDLSAQGAPVGVRTAVFAGRTVEVWYPTTDHLDDGADAPDVLDLADFVGPDFVARVEGDVTIPTLTTRAVRDAPARVLDERLPLVVFSHGFGGFRSQSVDLTSHLASRGYVVVAPDHDGRSLAAVAPCLFNPPAGTCALSFDVDDVGDLTAALDGALGLDDDVGALIDPDAIGAFGHSAGGAATVTFANAEPRVAAALPMAGAGAFTRDLPSRIVGGSCDGVVPETSLRAEGPTASEGYLAVVDAGHMAFSDLCRVDLGAVGEALLARDDVSPLFARQMITLAVDGCPGYAPPEDLAGCGGAYPPAEDVDPAIRAVVTAFFDQHLYGRGDGVDAVSSATLEVRGP